MDASSWRDRPAELQEAVANAALALDPSGVLEVHRAREPERLVAALRERGLASGMSPTSGGAPVVRVGRQLLPPVEDLTELEPCLPLERALLGVSELAPGAVYMALLPRYPRLLLPHLDARRVQWRIEARPDGTAVLWARRPA
jgi:hypothetical protein